MPRRAGQPSPSRLNAVSSGAPENHRSNASVAATIAAPMTTPACPRSLPSTVPSHWNSANTAANPMMKRAALTGDAGHRTVLVFVTVLIFAFCRSRSQACLAHSAQAPPRATIPVVTTPAPPSREALRKQHQLLLAGLVAIWIATSALIYFGVAPLLPDTSVPLAVPIACCMSALLAAWFWARPKVPRRTPLMTTEEYWRDGRAGTASALVIFVFEGSSMLAVVWSLMSGSWLAMATSLAGIVGVALHSPERIERESF